MAATIYGPNEPALISKVIIIDTKTHATLSTYEAGIIVKFVDTKNNEQLNVKVEIDDDGKNRAII